MSADDEIVLAFLEESRENLDQLDRDLVDLEARATDPALLGRVFRTIHTIKGTCGFLGFRHLEELTHAGETLLGALRAGDLVFDPSVTTSLLQLVDAIRLVLAEVEATGAEGDADHAALIAALLAHVGASADEPVPTDGVDEVPDIPDMHADADEDADADAADPEAVAGDAAPDAPVAHETSVRVDVTVLDKLLDLVGELVLTRTQIGDIAGDGDDDSPLALPYRQLRLVTAELQDGVMRARLQPVGTVTGRFRRIARDLAAALGKQVRVELVGEEVGVDKAVNEALRDPLLHLVRNAVDHGIELPAERLAAGKPAEGTLRIRAWHEGGRVEVEVSDDGRGIDADRLVESAVRSGLLTAAEAATLTEAQRLDLMFRPGLTTKSEVTSVSGRGVGMDVVRANLEQVGGSIDVESQAGAGTRFRINVPLTLAIMPALVVWSGGERYAVPQVDVQEIVRLDEEAVAGAVDVVDGVRLHRLRGRLLPLVDLADLLRTERAAADDGLRIVVVRNGGRRFGLVVDAIGDTIEAVVKPLTRAVRAIPVFSGVTILGDGLPALLLDVAGVAAGSGTAVADGDEAGGASAGVDGIGVTVATGLLLATGADGGALAFPLSAVRRLERFPAERVERTGGADVVQYGRDILPLVRVTAGAGTDVRDLATGADGDDDEALVPAVVCASSAGLVGVVVHRIEDVVPEPMTGPRQADGRGDGRERVVVGGRVTELVDVEAVVAAAGLGRSA